MRNNKRRHNDARMYNRALKKISTWESDPTWLEWRVKRVYNNLTNCSCCMCKTERKNGWSSNRMKLTMQERRSEDEFADGQIYWYDYEQYEKYNAIIDEDYNFDYADDYFWGSWWCRDTPEIMHLKWKYFKEMTDESYMWYKLTTGNKEN